MSGLFEPRPIRPTGIRHVDGWRLKHYEITVDSAPIADAITAAVDDVLRGFRRVDRLRARGNCRSTPTSATRS